MYLQSLFIYHKEMEDNLPRLLCLLRLFLQGINQLDSKTSQKLTNGWQELITTIITKYMTIIQRWKEDNMLVSKSKSRRQSTSNPTTPRVSSMDSEEETKENKPNDMIITAEFLEIVINDIIPIISLVFDENSIGTMIELGKQFENNLMKPGNNDEINRVCIQILNLLLRIYLVKLYMLKQLDLFIHQLESMLSLKRRYQIILQNY